MAIVGLVFSAFSIARAVDFPLDAGGDIASDGPDGWNGSLSAAVSEGVSFVGDDAEYVASRSVTLGEVTVGASSTFRFGNSEIGMKGLYMPRRGITAVVFGGIIDFSGCNLFACGKNAALSGDAGLLLTNGCRVVDVGTLSVAYKDSGNTVRVSDNSKVSA